ncbi:hypothetical protein DE146DRAFT_222555 [Phaeosphaeria sp. MPI-PUGE-AT-0046c]|nr:hypothetical protein DE146DRAFT_222555 [Phaeosphaeria sp. MPI-PUGE-AT-0046c]
MRRSLRDMVSIRHVYRSADGARDPSRYICGTQSWFAPIGDALRYLRGPVADYQDQQTVNLAYDLPAHAAGEPFHASSDMEMTFKRTTLPFTLSPCGMILAAYMGRQDDTPSCLKLPVAVVHTERRHTRHRNNTTAPTRNICCVVGGAQPAVAPYIVPLGRDRTQQGYWQRPIRAVINIRWINGSAAHWQIANRASSFANPPIALGPSAQAVEADTWRPQSCNVFNASLSQLLSSQRPWSIVIGACDRDETFELTVSSRFLAYSALLLAAAAAGSMSDQRIMARCPAHHGRHDSGTRGLRAARARPRTACQFLAAPLSAFDCLTVVLRVAALPRLLCCSCHGSLLITSYYSSNIQHCECRLWG